jgi:predicted NUDIX family NTP pyrophosphohydrolase
MPKRSAGLLLFRRTPDGPRVLLVHPGGPFWTNKDDGAWSIPKGEFDETEDALAAAKREFVEELGEVPSGSATPLAPVKQAGGKIVYAWALEADFDVSTVKSNTFSVEWPPRSGRVQEFPEVDRAEWFDMTAARQKILKGQVPLLDELQKKVGQ